MKNLKCLQQVKKIAESMGCSLDEDMADDTGLGVDIDCKKGYAFYASDCSTICCGAGSVFGGSWWAEACKDIMKDLSLGIYRLDPDDEFDRGVIKEIEWSRDEEWRASPDDPKWIYPEGPRDTQIPGRN